MLKLEDVPGFEGMTVREMTGQDFLEFTNGVQSVGKNVPDFVVAGVCVCDAEGNRLYKSWNEIMTHPASVIKQVATRAGEANTALLSAGEESGNVSEASV